MYTQVNNDVWLLTLGAPGSGKATWRVLAEWPSSIFSCVRHRVRVRVRVMGEGEGEGEG